MYPDARIQIHPQHRVWSVRSRLRLGLMDGAAAILAAALLAVTFASIRSDLTYDESVYLTLARQITVSGLPQRPDNDDLHRLRMFQNSPPLIPYVSSLSQLRFPGNELPARMLYVALFILPAYALVWWTSRSRFGPFAGFAALLALLGSGSFLAATSHVLLDVPLGLMALATLLCFERACGVGRTPVMWPLLAALGLVLATWTKYQAICICGGIGIYCAYLAVTEGERGVRRFRVPLLVVIAVGALALAVLLVYFGAFGDRSTLMLTATYNAARMSSGDLGPAGIVRAALGVGMRSVWTIGGVLLLAAGAAPLVQRRHRGLLVALGGFVLVTLVFNLALFRLPGSGTYYLQSALPAIAVLAGAAAAGIVDLTGSLLRGGLVTAIAAATQIVGSPPSTHMAKATDGSRSAAAYIAAHGNARAGVLALTPAIQFYTGNPVGIIPYTGERALLESLSGTGANDIAFVVIPRGEEPAGTEHIRREWDDLLSRRFAPAPIDVSPLLIYQRSPAGAPDALHLSRSTP